MKQSRLVVILSLCAGAILIALPSQARINIENDHGAGSVTSPQAAISATLPITPMSRADIIGTRADTSTRAVPDRSSPAAHSIGSGSFGGILNGDFENGRDGSWAEFSTHGWDIVTTAPSGLTAHSGSWVAWLGGELDDTSFISQSVTITASASTLRFWYWIYSEDACDYDFGDLLINSAVVHTFDLCAANNTNGWAQFEFDLASFVGQSISLQWRVITDPYYDSGLFIDDIALGEPNTYIYLPCVFKNYCPPYFDNFSNPNSGWSSGDDAFRTYRYLGGEYQIVIKHAQDGYLVTPDLVLPPNYLVEVDARQASSSASTYGIVFAARASNNQLADVFQFLVNPHNQNYFLEKKKNGVWSTLIDWTFSAAINADNASNHLRVRRIGSAIYLEVNGTALTTYDDGDFTSAGRDAGVRVYSGDAAPVDVRFDNFYAVCLP